MYSFINKKLKNYMGIIFASIFMLSIITIPQSVSADEIIQNEATEIDANFRPAYFNLGLAYYDLGKLNNAYEAFCKVLEILFVLFCKSFY